MANIAYNPQVAREFLRVADEMGASRMQKLALLSAGLVESNLDLNAGGHADSVGPLQQRPSQGWGTPEQLNDPAYAARQFLEYARSVNASNAAELAALVQRPAAEYRGRYAERMDDARWLLRHMSGDGHVAPRRPLQAASRSDDSGPIVDEDHSPMLMTVLQTISQHMRGAPDPDETPEEATVRQATGIGATPAEAPVDEERNPNEDPGVEALHRAGDTQTGTRARSDPNWSPLAWGGYENGRIPESELVKVDGRLLAPDAARSWRRMKRDAKRDGVDLSITEGYRDYATQVAVREEKGDQVATATPGTSVHGWGKAVDAGPEGREWIQQHGEKYGWIWPEWAQDSGFSYEPWHFEFSGGA